MALLEGAIWAKESRAILDRIHDICPCLVMHVIILYNTLTNINIFLRSDVGNSGPPCGRFIRYVTYGRRSFRLSIKKRANSVNLCPLPLEK